VAWQGFQDWTAVEPLGNSPAVIVETANPAKFPVEVQKVVGWEPDVPNNMIASLKLPENFDRLPADYGQFKAYLRKSHG
jgi:threonine synthase